MKLILEKIIYTVIQYFITSNSKNLMKSSRILIVEDEKIHSLNLSSILQRLGYTIIAVVCSGIEAIETATTHNPDVIVIDIDISGAINGIEIARRIQLLLDVPIVFLIGNSEDAIIEKSKLANPYGYILKPFNESEIRLVLEIALFRHKRENDLKHTHFLNISEGYNENNKNNLRKSEMLFRQVWENSRDGMRIVDANGTILLANPAYCEIIGKPIHEVIGQIYSTVYIEEQQGELLNTFRQRISTNSIVTNYEKKLRLWNGKEVWLELSNSYVDTGDGNTLYLLSIVHDITERKATEEQIQKSLVEKEVLLKELHHRVKNNMQIISSLLHLQEQNIADTLISTPLRESQNRVKSMALIHEQLYQSDNLSEVNINVYLRQLSTRLLRSIIGSKRNISISIEPEEAIILLNIDIAIPMGLILNELITNALKYAFIGKSEGRINISILKDAEAMYQMTIQDNGNGISPEINIANTETLGLQLVHSLAKQLGGHAMCLSTSTGTTFTITFPER